MHVRVCIVILLTHVMNILKKNNNKNNQTKTLRCEPRILTKFAWVHTTRYLLRVFDFVIPSPRAAATRGAAVGPLAVSVRVCN